mgnify:FL=1
MKQEHIDYIRAFNRFYTKNLGILNKTYLGSEFGLPEIRVIQDVYLYPNRNAKAISIALNMDKGLLSRILKKLEMKGYIYREKTIKDSRAELISLTNNGIKVYHTLDIAANQSVKEIFAGLEENQLLEIVKSMTTISFIMARN